MRKKIQTRLSSYSNLGQRVITAIIGAALMIFGIYWSEWSYLVLFVLIGGLSQLEFYRLVGLDDIAPLKYYGTGVGVFMNILTFLIEKHYLHFELYFLLSPLFTLIFFIKLYKKNEIKPFTNIAYTFLGIIYVAIPFALITVIALLGGTYSYERVLGCLFLLWASDSGAYFAGTKFGRTKLFERVSPKKSWEGSFGGAVTAMVVAYILSQTYADLNPWQWYWIAAVIVVAGTYGDLVESLFKRSIQIKDSGSVIPGHGGFLDRFDGLLLSAPFIVTFLKVFE
ncbi:MULTISPECIES: phosphatidate cytidylyltransferase [unclassified Siphonobacter]|uniref:phosphatidate cytidylyltransferase n=1 Tax=unclassified Siphonobacter TaxID=2635712 RepID=UPI000CC3B7D5|nr:MULTISPECIES: phosphatidate cytidylyltransferase [unclassified Siphonobacter]MDQ1089401.1 phosphatidate cytidylyltransferase [Siphonobacter sp. SORGH_AS_1065]MDR6195576.1 phosphatidate cytidylyltransferase [Siphonobacter sp. SORGH_AS_0500]PKK35320.1 phosphatidate cytidylyltransferase [Siphonobacter sp. SORGH_AS_0500]